MNQTNQLPAAHAERASQETIDTELWEYEVGDDTFGRLGLPELPPGYGYSGGAARAVALDVLFGERAPIRDLDVVAFGDFNPDPSLISEISRQHMPDDVAHGHGVREEALGDYFASRDFTVNEVAVVNGKLLLTRQAKDDLRAKIVRPTQHEAKLFGGTGPRLAIRALLMQSVFEQTHGHGSTADIDLDGRYIDDFYLALGLNKAFQYGPEVTRSFTQKLEKYGLVGEGSGSDSFALGIALEGVTDFVFRGSDAAEQLGELAGQPSSDILTPLHVSEEYRLYAEAANRFRGRGEHWVGKDEY